LEKKFSGRPEASWRVLGEKKKKKKRKKKKKKSSNVEGRRVSTEK